LCEHENEPVKAENQELESNIKTELQALEKIKTELSKSKEKKINFETEIRGHEIEINVIKKEIASVQLHIDV
jgi:chromosome segregation ATPase